MELETTQVKQEEKVEKVEKKVRPQPKTCPVKYSNFFVTINSNKNMASLAPEEYNATLNKFKEVITELFNVEIKKFIILSGSKIAEKFGMPCDAPREELEKRIESAKIEFVFEIGEQTHKLHTHGMISLRKRGTNSKLDYDGIRKWLEEKLGYVCHFQSLLYRDAKQNLQTYISKSPVD